MAKKKGGGKKEGGPKKDKKGGKKKDAPKKEDVAPELPPEPILVPPKEMPPKKDPTPKLPGHLMNLTTGSLVDYLPGPDSPAFQTNYFKAGEASSDVLGRMKGKGVSSTGGSEFVCDENKFHIDYEGYQEEGYTAGSEMPRICDYYRNSVDFDSDELIDDDIDWAPILESGQKKAAPKSTFAEIDELNRTIRLADTVITKCKFDSVVLFGFGETPVQKYTLSNGWIQVDVLDFGATIASIRVNDGCTWTDVVLGFDNVADYINSKSEGIGGTVGRVIGTIENGQFKLVNESGKHTVLLSKNIDENHVDGGFRPLHKRMWSGMVCGDRLVLSTSCADGEDGYPGRLQVWATFSLTGDCSLNVEYSARADTVTPVSIASRLAFNLAGHSAGAESLYNHSVFINAELCCDPSVENGDKLCLVYNTPYDLTDLKHLGCVMAAEGKDELDVNYALYRNVPKRKNPLEMIPKANMITAAVARDEESGRTLVVSTDQWGLRFHTCSNLEGLKGKGGAQYGKHAGLCLQTGSLPNAVNIDHFPNIFITPFETYRHATRYHFTMVRDSLDVGVISTNQPWHRNQVQLSCDETSLGPRDKSDEFETLYKKTYETLEKLAHHRCTDNLDDEDSLSLHSSFTSFGSEEHPPEEMPIDEEPGPADDFSKNWTTSMIDPFSLGGDIFEHSDQILVKTYEPLPPYLSGKWPQIPPKDIPLSKKECLPPPPSESKTDQKEENATLAKKTMETPKPYHVEVMQSKNKGKGENPKNFIKLELSFKDSKPNFGVKESLSKCEEKDKTKVDLDLMNIPESNLDLEDIRIPGENAFRWYVPPERLPWYCGTGREYAVQIPVLPEGKRKRMGAFFKAVNFPEGYTDIEVTPEDLYTAVKTKVECLRSHYDSIKQGKYDNSGCKMKQIH